MALGILALGHGGGVPGPIPNTPVGSNGNTNYALIPNFSRGWVDPRYRDFERDSIREGLFHSLRPTAAMQLLFRQPFYLIDCGPETALHLCGVFGDKPVASQVKGIFLTHTHDDHSGGIKSLAYRTRFIENTKPILGYPPELDDLIDRQTAEFGYLNPTTKPNERGTSFFYDVRIWSSPS